MSDVNSNLPSILHEYNTSDHDWYRRPRHMRKGVKYSNVVLHLEPSTASYNTMPSGSLPKDLEWVLIHER
jgi:hypothetical protein